MAAIRSGIKALFGSKASLSEARPIDVGEFAKALGEVCGPLGKDGAQPRKFGLAISGGVDSMALAALCSRLQAASRSQDGEAPLLTEFRAFVVDHGVREGSNDEANSVAKIMAEKGIQTQVLQIDWKGLEKPGDTPNFESLARRQRYQILGKACRDLGIGSLLLAHHEDDQAETVLMRLINGHRKTGLTGMEFDAGFPECRGIHGIHESGGDQAKSALFYPNTFLREIPFPPQLSTETGGLRLHRPMLSFPKSRLIATCQAENMEWFEDATNKDPTLTARNAIRYIYNCHTMPAALSKPAILGLAERAKANSVKQQELVDYYLSQCEIPDFQTRSGLLRVRFPTLDLPSTLSQEGKEAIGANIVRHIIMLVTPSENIPISSLSRTTRRIFPELYPHEIIEKTHQFSVANVDIRHGKHDIRLKPRYLISRAPYHRNRIPTYTFLPSSETSETQEMPWSEWRLFDGRYWIRIKHKTTHSIQLRPFLPTDSQSFDKNLSQASCIKLKQLSPIASTKIKWTLPCLVLQEKIHNGEDAKKEEKVLALPSFGVGIQEAEKFVEYEIKYKKVYWGALPKTPKEQIGAVAVDTPPTIRKTAGDIKDDKRKPLLRYHDYMEPQAGEKEKPLVRKYDYGTKVIQVQEKPLIRYPKVEKEKPQVKEKPLIRYHQVLKERPLVEEVKEKQLVKEKPLIRYHQALKERSLDEEVNEKPHIRHSKTERPLVWKHSYGFEALPEKPLEDKPVIRYIKTEKEEPPIPAVNGEEEEKPPVRKLITDLVSGADQGGRQLVRTVPTEKFASTKTLVPLVSFIPPIKKPTLLPPIQEVQKIVLKRSKTLIRRPKDPLFKKIDERPLVRVIPVEEVDKPLVRRTHGMPSWVLDTMDRDERSQAELSSEEKKPSELEEEWSQEESRW